MPANVTVLKGLTSSHSRKDPPPASGQPSAEMTCLRPDSACSCLLRLSVSLPVLFLYPVLLSVSKASTSFPPLFLFFLFLYLPLTLPFFVCVTMATAFFKRGGEAAGPMEDAEAHDALSVPSLSFSFLNRFLFPAFT